MENKRIILVSTTDNMIWQFLLPHIKHLQSLGNTVECACAKTGFWFEELQTKFGLVMHEINFTRNPLTFKNMKAFKKLVKLQKQQKYDVVYCQQPVGGVMGRKLGKKFKLPVIYTVHGFHFFNGCPLVNKLIYKNIEKWYSKYTDALVTMNNEDFENAKKFKAKRVYKINGIGVDLSKYKVNEKLNKVEIKKSLGINDGDFVLTSIGELNKNKNTFRVLQIIKDINNPKLKYLICGQGPLKEEYESFIKENGLEENVKLLGFRKDIPDILQISNAFIMPSYREGLPMSMTEAMCYGLPIVASKIRGNTDLVGENEGGLLCDPEDDEAFKTSLISIMQDEKLAKKFGDRNKKFVKNFDINIVLKQMEEIYKEF